MSKNNNNSLNLKEENKKIFLDNKNEIKDDNNNNKSKRTIKKRTLERVRFEIPNKFDFNLSKAKITCEGEFEKIKKSYKDAETLYKYYDIAKALINDYSDSKEDLKDVEFQQPDLDSLLVQVASLFCETGCSPNNTDIYKIKLNYKINEEVKSLNIKFTSYNLLEIIKNNVNNKLMKLIEEQRKNQKIQFNIEYITVRNFIKKLMNRYSQVYKTEIEKIRDERKYFKHFNLEHLTQLDDGDGLSDAVPYKLLPDNLAEVMRLYLNIYKVAREYSIKMDKVRIEEFISIFLSKKLWRLRIEARIRSKKEQNHSVFDNERKVIELMLKGMYYEDDFDNLYQKE